MIFRQNQSIRTRLLSLFVILLLVFSLVLSLLYNSMLQRRLIQNYNESMQRHAYAISQNLSEMIAPSGHAALDETRFIVSEDTLAPYLALIEQITSCNVYIIDSSHNVTGYFDGVVQRLQNPLLPGYLEQTIALGFMGKTPFIQADTGEDIHLTACMPIMNESSRVLGVVLLETTLRELGFAQVPSGTILLTSIAISLPLASVLAIFFSRLFTHPISQVQKFAHALAGGCYELRMKSTQQDEIGALSHSMDILAERLEDARARDEQLRNQQQTFFANISHELKTPVTVIRGSLEALSDGVVTKPEDVQAYYQQMIAESRSLQRLILDLLELSRLQNLEFSLDISEFSLVELMGDVAMSAHTLCERKGISFHCEEPKTDYRLTGDCARVRQMLLAVIDNAVKYTPAGKGVRMALRADSPVITIEDEGVGIPEEELKYIFDRFHHARGASRESTGLGLAIVQEIARRHGIRIDVRSREGEGTVFTFIFPRQPQTVLHE